MAKLLNITEDHSTPELMKWLHPAEHECDLLA